MVSADWSIPVAKTTTIKAPHEVAQLHWQWKRALDKMRETHATEDEEREYELYDQLVEAVEQNGLNYTQWDPRGASDADR